MISYFAPIALLLAGASIASPAPAPVGVPNGIPEAVATHELDKRQSGARYSIYYYNDYQSCIDSYNQQKSAPVSAENVPINGHTCFSRNAFPYYTLAWWDATLTQVCNGASSDPSVCGVNCESYNQPSASFLCANTGFQFTWN